MAGRKFHEFAHINYFDGIASHQTRVKFRGAKGEEMVSLI
jgi:hypothetical protein